MNIRDLPNYLEDVERRLKRLESTAKDRYPKPTRVYVHANEFNYYKASYGDESGPFELWTKIVGRADLAHELLLPLNETCGNGEWAPWFNDANNLFYRKIV